MHSLEWPTTLYSSQADCIYVYRSMILFNQLHNNIFGSFLLPLFKLNIVFAIFVSAYSLIRLRDSLSIAIYLFFMLYLITLIVLVVPGALLMSFVYNISCKFHTNVMNMPPALMESSSQGRVISQKTVDSLPVLKCTIGAFYHMEGV